MKNFIRHIPLFGIIFQKKLRIHKEAFTIFFISWIIINIPLLLNLLKNINDKKENLVPWTITDIIVYSISFLAPFVFCYKKQKSEPSVFQDSKEACCGLCILILSVSLLSFYFTFPAEGLRQISKIIIGILYFISLFLWYFSILTSIDEDRIEENIEDANSTIKHTEQNFVEQFNESIEKEQVDE